MWWWGWWVMPWELGIRSEEENGDRGDETHSPEWGDNAGMRRGRLSEWNMDLGLKRETLCIGQLVTSTTYTPWL